MYANYNKPQSNMSLLSIANLALVSKYIQTMYTMYIPDCVCTGV